MSCISNKSVWFSNVLARETEMKHSDAISFVKWIPTGHLDKAIDIYKQFGYLEMKKYVFSIKNINAINFEV